MECHVIGCKENAVKIITKKNGNHDMDLPVCEKHTELINDDEVCYQIEQ
jgi:hypothetical protein